MILPHTSDFALVQSMHALPAILKALSSLTGLRLAALVRVTDNDWTPCAVLDGLGTGIKVGDVWNVEGTACRLVRDRQAPVTLADAQEHIKTTPSAFTVHFGIRAYFGYPVYRADGTFFGALCVMDTGSAPPSVPGLVDTARAFSEIIGAQLGIDATGQQEAAIARGLQQPGGNSVGSVRVLSVLAHDLRNPMHSLLAALEMLRMKPLEPRAERLVGMVQASAVRLSELAQQTMDYARSQIAGDVPLHITPRADLVQPLRAVADDVGRAYPQRLLDISLNGLPPVDVDTPRIAQAVSALLVHGVKHAGPDATVALRGRVVADNFLLCVDVPGYIVPAALHSNMFDPFHTVDDEPQTAQFGVGLYLGHWIAQAHGGSLALSVSDEGAATFTMTLPLKVHQG